ncbi:E3 ubiquitin/ISG15 ligase TRIM25-like [Mixophyes fleayi]|uniref:E3 ubiquitin/ISG15 ligase TRIM25-like n=1 Tax=Mixophyes fleayi TaxID=3061075 RepID=UPI003F4DE180
MDSADLGDELNCSICLNVYTEPVTLSCGHNFCQVCIVSVLDTHEGSGAYTCPDCRAEFQERPALHRNVTLCNIAKRYLSTHSEYEETRVCCTYCIHSTVPAVKYCLMCEAYLCDNHLKVHSKSEEHVLTESSTALHSKKCSVHKKALQYYCMKDSICICLTCCLAGEHKGHQVEPLIEATEKKKKKLKNILKKLISKEKQTERSLQTLQEHQSRAQEKTADEVERVTALFRNIRRQLEDLEKIVLSMISRQEERVSLISDLIQQLEIKKNELCSKICHIETLCDTTDPLTFLEEQETNREDFCDVKEGNIEKESKKFLIVDDLDKDLILETLNKGFCDIMTGAKKMISGHNEEDLLLDVNTAGINTEISADLKTASWSQIKQILPETSRRFQRYQVLSTKHFSSGQHFWDVETNKLGVCSLGMCYPSIPRKGDVADIGYNNKSWSLWRPYNSNKYLLVHDSKEIQATHNISCQRFRIYLDYEAGQLSFYELCDPIRHLHTFTTTFTEPLHAAFYVCNAWIRIRS